MPGDSERDDAGDLVHTGTYRTASIIASQLQEHNGGLFEDVTGAELLAGMWAAGFTVTDNDSRTFRVLVTPESIGMKWIPPEDGHETGH